MKPFTFINYDKITDKLMWLGNINNQQIWFKFIVALTTTDRNNNEKYFHSEYKYYSKRFGRDAYNIIRNYNFYFMIDCGFDFKSCILRMQDVYILNILIDSQIIPWYMGPTRIFDMVNDKMIVNGSYNEVTMPLNESTYIKFSPVTVYDENFNTYKEGIRLELNSKDMWVDITIDQFLEFVYIIKNTDMLNYAANLLTYVKTEPYNVNLGTVGEEQKPIRHLENNLGNINKSGKKGNFFDK